MWVGASLSLQAQALEEVPTIPKDITDAFQVGNSKMLGPWLSERITITLNGKSSLYKPVAAQKWLKNFFKKNPPLGLDFIHQGISQQKAKHQKTPLFYYIATYRSRQAYRMHMLVKRSAQGHRIRRISFDKQETTEKE